MASEYENGAFLPHSVRRSMDGCLEELENLRFVDRIWHQDETLWDSNRAETRQRLGWLDAPTTMLASEDSWKSFQSELLSAGFRHAVLLGMGGSSLGAEVLNRVVAAGAEQIRLHVLDSTLPESVRAVVSSVDMSRTLFIVSSKSGSTVEPNLLYDYFRGAVEEASGAAQAGGHFIAITDPGTSLERMAGTHGFRRVFTNPANIGGRYSVLSLFGLVPGAVLGINNRLLLENAVKMSEQCGPDESGVKNPGVELAAYMVGCQRVGRDKLTLVTSPRVANFGL